MNEPDGRNKSAISLFGAPPSALGDRCDIENQIRQPRRRIESA
jgi:hypothetical protein